MNEGGAAVAMGEEESPALRRAPGEAGEHGLAFAPEFDPVAAREGEHLLVVFVGLVWRRRGRVGNRRGGLQRPRRGFGEDPGGP